jgi:hypothetical protein
MSPALICNRHHNNFLTMFMYLILFLYFIGGGQISRYRVLRYHLNKIWLVNKPYQIRNHIEKWKVEFLDGVAMLFSSIIK